MAFWNKPWWGKVTGFLGNLFTGLSGMRGGEADETGLEELQADIARLEETRRQQTTIIMIAVIGVGILIGIFVLFGSKKKRK